MNAFLIFLIFLLDSAATLIFLAQLLPSRMNAGQTIAVAVFVTVPLMIRMYMEIGSLPYVLITWLGYLLGFGCLFLYRGKLWRKLLLLFYFIVVKMLSETLVINIFSLALHKDFSVLFLENRMSMTMITILTLTLILFIILGSFTVLVWRMVSIRIFQPFFLLFFILPTGQLITVFSFESNSFSALWVLGLLITLIADLMLLVYTISQVKKTDLEEELRETRHAMELEQSYYHSVELRREELAKIRHDINNHLAAISQLIRSGREGSAQDMIAALSEEIIGTKENLYCDIPVVNAILAEKALDCVAAKIDLSVELELPNRLAIEPMHLCSIFGNLLDNAISACKRIDLMDKPSIRLTSMIDGDYLFIKVVNPSDKPPRDPLPGHGYGSRILRDLTKRYNGDYRTEYKDRAFIAVASLLAADKEA